MRGSQSRQPCRSAPRNPKPNCQPKRYKKIWMPGGRDSQSGEPNVWRGKFHYLCQECREISLTLAGRWILSAAINEKLSINQRDHFRHLCHSTCRVRVLLT